MNKNDHSRSPSSQLKIQYFAALKESRSISNMSQRKKESVHGESLNGSQIDYNPKIKSVKKSKFYRNDNINSFKIKKNAFKSNLLFINKESDTKK